MADIDIPVWSFRANWKDGVIERLSFLTDVLTAEGGAEQRRSIRITPRRTLETDLLLTREERTFYDLFVNRLGGGEVLVPLYWDIAKTSTATAAGITDRIDFDNQYREFTSASLALIMGKTAFDYEVIEIETADDDGISLVNPVARQWPKGTPIMPLRKAILDDQGDLGHSSAAVAGATVRLIISGANPWLPAADPSPVYGGLPVMLDEPNWVSGLSVAMDRQTDRLDLDSGLITQTDPLLRALLGQQHQWFLNGRPALAAFRDLVYRHRGRAGSFWLPTFKADLVLAAPALSSATQIVVNKVGMQYVGGPTSGREYIAIKHAGGTILRKITGVLSSTSKTETLSLDAPLGLALSTGQVRRISFLDTARFDSDDFEITHHTDIDGLSTVNTTFRTFKNIRTAPDPVWFPIPAAAKTSGDCGTPVASDCYAYQPYEGWDYKWMFSGLRVDGGPPAIFAFFWIRYPDGTQFDKASNGAPDGPVYALEYESSGSLGTYTLKMKNFPLQIGTYNVYFEFYSLSPVLTCRFRLQHWDDPLASDMISPVTQNFSFSRDFSMAAV